MSDLSRQHELSQDRAIKALRKGKAALRRGVVTAVSPLEVSVGGGSSLPAFAVDGCALSVNDQVSVIQQGSQVVVQGRLTDDPVDAGSVGASESWINVSGGVGFSGTWTNFGSGYNDAGYYKDPLGRVHLRGLVKSGTIGTGIFTLPSGYRPASIEVHAIASNAAFGYIDISTAGVVRPLVGNNAWVSLDGITFRV